MPSPVPSRGNRTTSKAPDEYTIHKHRHGFAAWAASRAASVVGNRFSVEDGRAILEVAGMEALIASPDLLPSPGEIDTEHRAWRDGVIKTAKSKGLKFTHGVAAKLINTYFKAAFVCGGHHDHARVRALHPPIDALLLGKLAKQDVGGLRKEWNKAGKIRWSKFDSGQYERVIGHVREAMRARPLWKVEEYWQGFQ